MSNGLKRIRRRSQRQRANQQPRIHCHSRSDSQYQKERQLKQARLRCAIGFAPLEGNECQQLLKFYCRYAASHLKKPWNKSFLVVISFNHQIVSKLKHGLAVYYVNMMANDVSACNFSNRIYQKVEKEQTGKTSKQSFLPWSSLWQFGAGDATHASRHSRFVTVFHRLNV